MKRIHVNQLVIRHNNKYGNTLPACRVEDTKTKKTTYAHEVKILGPSTMVYRPDDPLPCGAKLWIETDGPIKLVKPCVYADIREQMEELKALQKK